MDRAQSDRHEFGSRHTVEKLGMLEKYLPAYTTALKRRDFALHYIDAFAGTGVCNIKLEQKRRLLVPGSAKIALECEPPFHRMVFIEKKPRHVKALQRLAEQAPDRTVDVVAGDANHELPRVLEKLNRRRDRAVVFLDPYGMNLQWATLERVARSKLADVWYLFPLSGLYRQAARDAADIDEDKARSLTTMLGTEAWRSAFYKESPQGSLFDEAPTVERHLGPMQMKDWVTSHLRTIFSSVVEPKILYQTTPNGTQGAPLFALYFAVSNDSGPAIGLATKIAKDIFSKG